MKKRPSKKIFKEDQVVYGKDELKSSTRRRRPTMRSQTLEISLGNVQDQIAAFLYATRQIPEDVDIKSIDLGKVNPKTGLLPLKLKLETIQ